MRPAPFMCSIIIAHAYKNERRLVNKKSYGLKKGEHIGRVRKSENERDRERGGGGMSDREREIRVLNLIYLIGICNSLTFQAHIVLQQQYANKE